MSNAPSIPERAMSQARRVRKLVSRRHQQQDAVVNGTRHAQLPIQPMNLLGLPAEILDEIFDELILKDQLIVATVAEDIDSEDFPPWLEKTFNAASDVLLGTDHTCRKLPVTHHSYDTTDHAAGLFWASSLTYVTLWRAIGRQNWLCFSNLPQAIMAIRGQWKPILPYIKKAFIIATEGPRAQEDSQVVLAMQIEEHLFWKDDLGWTRPSERRQHATLENKKISGDLWRPEALVRALRESGLAPSRFALSWLWARNTLPNGGSDVVNASLDEAERFAFGAHGFDRTMRQIALFDSFDTIELLNDVDYDLTGATIRLDPRRSREVQQLTGKEVRVWGGKSVNQFTSPKCVHPRPRAADHPIRRARRRSPYA